MSTSKKYILSVIVIFLLFVLLLPLVNVKDNTPLDEAIKNAPGRILKINNRRIHFVDKGQGPVVVMVHGLLYNTVMWEEQIEHFSKNYRVIAVDLFGMGFSERLQHQNYSIKTFGEQILGLLDTLNVQEATFFGQSLGGSISVYIAAHHRERVSKLVLSSPSILPYSKKTISVIYELPFVGEFLNALPGDGMMSDNIKSTWYYDASRLSKEKLENILTSHKIKGTPDGFLYILREIIIAPMVKKEAEILARSPLPVLVVHGKQDEAVPLETSVDFIKMMGEYGKLVVFDKARHSPHEEFPNRFNIIAEKFLQKDLPGLNP